MASLKNLVESGLTEIPSAYIRSENERPAATQICIEKVPVIDLQGFHGSKRAEIVDAISKACQEWGFFQVINHGIPEIAVIEKMVEALHRFFDLPAEEKNKYRSDDGKGVFYGTSFIASKDKALQWRDFLGIFVESKIDTQTLESWPPALRDETLKFMIEVRRLAADLLSALSESLGISCNLENLMGFEKLLLNYYPSCPNPDKVFGVSSHSDAGLLTVLLQDEVGGLQVLHDNQWIGVQPIPNAFVINVGDSLQVLSNGRFQSVEHRVVPSPNRARISIPFFCDPDRSTVIKPLGELVNEENPPKYKSFNFGEFVDYILNMPFQGKKSNLDYARV